MRQCGRVWDPTRLKSLLAPVSGQKPNSKISFQKLPGTLIPSKSRRESCAFWCMYASFGFHGFTMFCSAFETGLIYPRLALELAM